MKPVKDMFAERVAQIHEDLLAHAERRYPPTVGGFTHTLLTNNFVRIMGQADATSVEVLPEVARILFNEIPAACWGSAEKVRAWWADVEDDFLDNRGSA